ncbi:MAG: hypothetical protein DMG90_17210 [Acidobacteria bacterium]|nr:MAG: hypothetical protein DMG90_17210 [Acidobacteriota bacterium]
MSEGSPFLYLINQQWQSRRIESTSEGRAVIHTRAGIKMQQRLSGISETQELVAGRSLGSY